MEGDFDKEIDTLLRKAQRDGPVLIGDFASSSHLDADELSAFAENAMPENSRALYTAHVADCDRCRKILSSLLMMNAETAPAAASPSVITIAERSIPWYKRLLLFPNLGYVMGGLVLIFAGFLGFTVIQKSGVVEDAMVSQSVESASTQGGPNFQDEPSYTTDATHSANTTSANSAANVTIGAPSAAGSNMNTSASTETRSAAENAPIAGARAGENFVLDGVAPSTEVTVTAAPPAAATQPTRPKDARERDDFAKEKSEDKASGGLLMQESAKSDLALKPQSPGSVNQSQAQSGPMRNNESQYNRQLENLDARARAAAKKSVKRDEESPSGRRTVGGKTFEGKQGVWYDTTFQGRPTINVRRGTDEFNKLDSGLRSIANSLSGTVVIVWGAKAYRIQ